MRNKLLNSLIFMSLIVFSSLSLAAETVNLNKASAAAIQQNLVGIGPIKAEAIISHRKKNGKFKSVDDLLDVTGIGPALIKKNKRYLSLSKGVTSGDDKAYAASKKAAGNKKAGTKTSKKKSSKTDKKSSSDSTTAKKSTKSSSKSSDTKTAKKKSTKKKSSTTAKPAKSSSSKKKAKIDCKVKANAKKSACKKKTSSKKKKTKKKKAKPAS